MSLRGVAKLFTSLPAAPGALFVAIGLGVASPPADMRLPEKLAAVGLAPLGALATRALLVAVGALKISVPLNSWVSKRRAVARAHFALALPGYLLVLWAHQAIAPPIPLKEDAPLFALIACMGVLAFTSDAPKVTPA